MRNLKKVLSLVLCMAMVLSVMVVGAGAAFKDQNKIVNTEAVDMCSALNIINGYTDGTFRPDGTITRAEACKMICVALNGGKEPILGTSASASFTDTKGHWAEQYIESCVAQGIVAGVGGGKFAPNATVTGSQFAKMLLIALGYNADNEGYVGAAWEINVNVQATAKDLYEDLETMDPSAALTRDNAAQMVWNALQAVIVEYDYTLVSNNGTLSSQVVVKDDKDGTTLLKDKYNALMTNDVYDTVTLTSYKWNDDNDEFDYTLTTDVVDAKTQKAITLDFSSTTDYTDLFAMQVNVVYKNNKDKDVYGIYAEDSVVLYEGVVSDLEAFDSDYVKVDGTKYKVDLESNEKTTSLAVIEAYAENQYTTKTGADDSAVVASYTMKVIDLDGNGKIDCIVYLPFETAKVTYVGTKDITLSTNSVTTKATFEDDYIYDGVAKDDYVAVVDDKYTAYDGNVITKLDSVAGTVSAVKADKVMIDGTWYNITTIDKNGVSEVKSFTLNDEYTLYVVGEYVYFAEEGENNQSLDDLVYVKATSNGDKVDAGKAKVYFADGTSATVTLTDSYFLADGTEVENVTNYSALDGKLCTFEKDDGDYELTLVGTGNDLGYDYASDTYSISAKDDNKAGKIGNTSVADDAVVFIVEKDGDVNVVTGTTAKSYKDAIAGTTGGVMLTEKVNGVKTVQVALVNADMNKLPNATGETELYAYVLDTPYQVKDGDDYYAVYTIWNGKEEVVVREELASKNSASVAYEGAIIEYTDLGNKEIDDVVIVAAESGEYAGKVAVKGTAGDEVYMTSGSSLVADKSGEQASAGWYITDDTVILYVDSEDMGGFTDGTIQNAREEAVTTGTSTSYKLIENAYLYGTLSNHEITLLVVETSNEWH